MLLQVQHVQKTYGQGPNQVIALKDVNFSVDEGEFIAIMGESGSGKTSLLNILATLDQPTAGEVVLNGTRLADISAQDSARFRRQQLGFVFQDFNVLNTFNNRDNILLPLVLSGVNFKEMQVKLQEVSQILGIEDLLNKFPYEVSGGQRQRIAIARAIITDPDLILADEPTGALDSKTADQIMHVFQRLNQAANTILMVTHSVRAASAAKRVLFIQDGIVFHEIYRGEADALAFQEQIANSLALLNRKERI